MGKRITERSSAAIGYIRVSTEEQATSGLGLAGQRRVIEAEAASHGWKLAEIISDEGLSAKTISARPGLSRALEILEAGEASFLIVSKLDRLARSVADFATLVRKAEKQGWAVVIADMKIDMSTPSGSLMANVSACVAEWERKVISERTKAALAVKRSQGVRLGKPRQVPSEVFDRIQAERSNGATLQSIATRLNEEGVLTPTGRNWTPATVRKIALQSPVVA